MDCVSGSSFALLFDSPGNFTSADAHALNARLEDEKAKRLLLQNDVDVLMRKVEQLTRDLNAVKQEELDMTRGVAFYAEVTSDITHIGNHQVIHFDKIRTNIGNAYNSNTAMFTAPSNGIYTFHWTITNKDQSFMNTELIARRQVYGNAMSDAYNHNDYAVAANLAVISLNKGDQVYIQSGTWHSGVLAGNYYSTFSGYRL